MRQLNYFKLSIDETGRNSLQEESQLFHTINETFETRQDLENYLIDRYGKLPNNRNKIYIDNKNESIEIGFTYSYWNKDYSHNSKSYFQTDWIVPAEISEQRKTVTF